MVDFKAEYHFKDGKLAQTVIPDTSGLTANDIVPIISVIEGMEIAAPQGLEKLIRRIGSPPGTPFKNLTEQQRDSIGEISDSKVKKTH